MAISLVSRHVYLLTSSGPSASDKMAQNGSYAAQGPGANENSIEYANDPAAGGFFATDFRKHEDLKNMLDGNKDGLKLEAMKRIIGMVAKGKDASDLFPAVVKNVVSKNLEVKKLVYVYLVRYAEEQQDLALLSISTFQRALKDPNQLIRASALRVLSSIRVHVIVPIMMLAIKDSANDMSPYVRKTAAHAIPKLYSLDPEQRDQLIEVIEKLLSDKTTLVVGSAVMAFEEVCPERVELIHKNYRKLCNLLVDVEEWGQVIIIHMLTRYARTQFMDPNKNGGASSEAQDDKHFYDSDESKGKEESEEKAYVMDPDHRLLLRNCKPLLQSRNAAVVMAVAQLYYYISPKNEINIIAKALIRLLHSHREVQSVVLSNIATITTTNKGIFEPYLKNFFVRSSEPTHIKLLKLEVLTNLATETNVSVILREFQTYVGSPDMEFVAATIQAIGRCASTISEVTDTCLNGLVLLLSNRNELVVAESVVVIKKLLQLQPSEYKNIIVHMAKLVDSIAVPMARASILWLLGEYADRVPKIAPDVLRKVAKTFVTEEDIVKLQTLNLAAKLFITNPKQTRLLCQYVFSLAKYDQNYDIRDRARFLRQLIMPQGEGNHVLSKYAKRVLLATKPAPILQSKFKDRDQFHLGSLSHYINGRASGYQKLPDFPEVAPDPSVRNVEVAAPWQEAKIMKKPKKIVKKSSFYSETESSSGSKSNSDDEGSHEYIGGSSGEDSESGSQDESQSESGEESEESSEESSGEESEPIKKIQSKKVESTEESSSEESSESESEDDISSDESSSVADNRNANIRKKPSPKPQKQAKSNLDLLLDLDDSVSVPVMQTTSITPGAIPIQAASYLRNLDNNLTQPQLNAVAPAWVSQKQIELLNRYNGDGLTVTYRFPRSSNIYSTKMTTIELTFKNESPDPIKGISIPDKKQGNVDIKGFPAMAPLPPNSTALATLGIDYNESTNPAGFELKTDKRTFKLTIKAPIGEIIQPVILSESEFSNWQDKLKGMNENVSQVSLPEGCNNNDKTLISKVYETANVLQITSIDPSPTKLRFAGQTLSTKSPVLISVQVLDNGKGQIAVNCEKMVIGSVLMKELKDSISK